MLNVVFSHLAVLFLGAGAVFFNGGAGEFWDRRKVVWKEKRALGKDVRDIAFEGLNSGYVRKPKNSKNIADVALRLEEYDKELALRLRQYLRIWKQMIEQIDNIEANKANLMSTADLMKLQRDVLILEDKLIEGAKLLRTPHGTWLTLKSRARKLALKFRKAGK